MELNEIDGGQNISEEPIQGSPLTSGRRAFSNRKIILAVASLGLVGCAVGLAFGIGFDDSQNVAMNTATQQSSKPPIDEIDAIFAENRNFGLKKNIEIKDDAGLSSPYRYDCEKIKCTPLDEYVWKDNKDYEYQTVAVYDHRLRPRPTRTIVVNMTSQNWLTEEDVTRTTWWHELVISIPYNYDPEMERSALMLIDGGSNKPGRILTEDDDVVKGARVAAESLGTIMAVLRQVPNEKLYFLNDPRMGESGRSEDDIIAWTWKHFLYHPDQPEWLLRMPMTKAARLALDTIDAVFKENRLGMGLSHMRLPIDNVMVTGASKRGWTTWTLASVDKRVKAAVPMVLDCLNMEEIFLEWYRNNGAWSFALGPYWDEGLTANFSAPEFKQMAEIIDPYYYRDRLTMPKMVISATGDEFFSPDDSYFWFDDMKGPTYLHLLPNAEHGMFYPPQFLSSHSMIWGIRSFYLSVMKNFPLPKMKWTRGVDPDGTAWVKLDTDKLPIEVFGWTADTRNNTRRDWRWAKVKNDKVDWPTNGDNVEVSRITEEDLEFQPIKWNRIVAWSDEEGKFSVSIPKSESGFRAVMIEVSYPGPDDRSRLTFTTEVMITPDERPFERCDKNGNDMDCIGYLI